MAHALSAEIILQNPKVNEKAPLFSAVNSYGEKINLADFQGQPVIRSGLTMNVHTLLGIMKKKTCSQFKKWLKKKALSGWPSFLQPQESKAMLTPHKLMI